MPVYKVQLRRDFSENCFGTETTEVYIEAENAAQIRDLHDNEDFESLIDDLDWDRGSCDCDNFESSDERIIGDITEIAMQRPDFNLIEHLDSGDSMPINPGYIRDDPDFF